MAISRSATARAAASGSRCGATAPAGAEDARSGLGQAARQHPEGRAEMARVPTARSPTGSLTPRDADGAADVSLAAARTERPAPRASARSAEACTEWLRYVELDRARRRRRSATTATPSSATSSALRRERRSSASRPTTSRPTARRCSTRGACRGARSRRSSCCYGILKRAKRKKWIARTRPRTPSGSRSSARETSTSCRRRGRGGRARCRDEQDAAIFLTAAFTGLRMGELRALRWADVDFAGETDPRPQGGHALAGGRAEVQPDALGPDSRAGRAGPRRAQPPGALRGPRRVRLLQTLGTIAVQAFALSDVKVAGAEHPGRGRRPRAQARRRVRLSSTKPPTSQASISSCTNRR